MKTRITIFLLTIAACLSAFAQSAHTLLDTAVEKIQKSTGIEAQFSLNILHHGNESGTVEGTLLLKGEQFCIDTPETIVWFDGTTEWNYVKNSDEVNISNPEANELNSINPVALLSLYQQGYTATLGTQSQYRGTAIHKVVLTATEGQNIQQVVVYLKKNSLEPMRIHVKQSDGIEAEALLKHYSDNKNLPEESFKFPKQHYPTAEVIDLR